MSGLFDVAAAKAQFAAEGRSLGFFDRAAARARMNRERRLARGQIEDVSQIVVELDHQKCLQQLLLLHGRPLLISEEAQSASGSAFDMRFYPADMREDELAESIQLRLQIVNPLGGAFEFSGHLIAPCESASGAPDDSSALRSREMGGR